jgi:hypothetical protein
MDNIKSLFNRKESNRAAEEKEYQRELDDEYNDILADKKEEYAKKHAEYSVQLKAWKLQRTRKVRDDSK